MIASCGFLENELRQCSKEEGICSVETLGVDLRTRVKKLGAKEEARRRKCKVRFSIIKKNKAFQKNYMKVGVKKLLRAGMVPARTWRVHAVGIAPTERLKIEETGGSISGQKRARLLLSFFHGSVWPGSGRRAFHHGHPVLGRRSLDWKMAARPKRSVDEANSRSSEAEAGERTCRSSDV